MRIMLASLALISAGASAVAEDMPAKSRPISAPAYNWTGAYIGGSVGYAWDGTSSIFERVDCADILIASVFNGCGTFYGTVPPAPASIKGTGGLAGLQAGYNYQFGTGLIGVEFDYSWARINGNGTSNFLYFRPGTFANPASSVVSGHKVTSFATIRGRLGWLPTQTWLIYLTGGVAFANIDHNNAMTLPMTTALGGGFGFKCAAGLPCFLDNTRRARTGYSVGAGTEFAVSPSVTIKAEYLYANSGGDAFTVRAVDSVPLLPG